MRHRRLFTFVWLSWLSQARDRRPRITTLSCGKTARRLRSRPTWIYDDLSKGIQVARQTRKPLLVVFRCIPCKACQKFDDDVARRDPVIRDLLDEFVCVRIPEANTIDLTHFQFDFDLSFAVFFMDASLTVYGRFGTRSGRPESVADFNLAPS